MTPTPQSTRKDNNTVHTIHPSAKDFLLSSTFLFPQGHAQIHNQMVLKSLEALSHTLTRDLCGLQAPAFRANNVPREALDTTVSMHYSCVFWVHHLEEADTAAIVEAVRDGQRVDGFMQKEFLHWLEALSLLRNMSKGVLAVKKLKALVEKYGGPQLNDFLSDAWRFVLAHKTPTEMTLLQVYSSALVFSPLKSLVRSIFQHEALVQLNWEIGQEQDWSQCLQTLEGHEDLVTSVALWPDDQYLISGSVDTTIKVWDVTNGDCLNTLRGHKHKVTSVAYCTKDCVASGSVDCTVKVWDLTTSKCRETLRGHKDKVTSLAYCAKDCVASGSRDSTVRVWNMATGDCTKILTGQDHPIHSVVSLADGCVASSSYPATVMIWNTTNGECLRTTRGVLPDLIASSLHGNLLALGTSSLTVQVYDLTTINAVPLTLSSKGSLVTALAFSSDGQHLAKYLSPRGLEISTFSTIGGSIHETVQDRILGGHDWTSIACLSNSRVIMAGNSHHVEILDISRRYTNLPARGIRPATAIEIQLSPDGQFLAVMFFRGIDIWEVRTGQGLETIDNDGWGGLKTSSTWRWSVLTQSFKLERKKSLASVDMAEEVAEKYPMQGPRLWRSSDQVWLCKGEEEIVWLPFAYRTAKVAFSGGKTAFALHSGYAQVLNLCS